MIDVQSMRTTIGAIVLAATADQEAADTVARFAATFCEPWVSKTYIAQSFGRSRRWVELMIEEHSIAIVSRRGREGSLVDWRAFLAAARAAGIEPRGGASVAARA